MGAQKTVRLRTTIVQTGGATTGIEVPAGIVESLGAGKRPAVSVTVGGYIYRSTIGSMGGRFMLPVSAAVRSAAGVSGGDAVEITLELDTAPREIAVPPELLKALKKDAAAKQAFDALSNSRKQRYTLPIKNAKAPETKERNVRKAIAELRAMGEGN